MALDVENWKAWDYKKAVPDTGFAMSPDGNFRLRLSGAGVVVGVEQKSSNGAFSPVAVGDAEQTRYIGAGLLDPRLYQAAAGYASTPGQIDDLLAGIFSRDKFEAAYLLGSLNDRGTYHTNAWSDAANFAPAQYWTAVTGYENSPWRAYFNDTVDTVHALGLDVSAGTKAVSKTLQNYSAQRAEEESRSDGLGGLLSAAALAAAAFFVGPEIFAAAPEAAAAEFVPTGAMSMAGEFGGYSTTAALQSSTPLWLQPALAGGAAGGLTAAEMLNTGKTALDAVSLGAKLSGGGASSAAGASLVSPGGISLPKIGATSQGAAMLQQPAMPGASPGVFLPEDSGAVPLLPILAGLGLLLFLGR